MPNLHSTFKPSHSNHIARPNTCSSTFPVLRRVHLSTSASDLNKHVAQASTRTCPSTNHSNARRACDGHTHWQVARRCQRRSGQAQCRALPGALVSLAETTLARDIAAASASVVSGVFLVKLFNNLQKSGILDQVSSHLPPPLPSPLRGRTGCRR